MPTEQLVPAGDLPEELVPDSDLPDATKSPDQSRGKGFVREAIDQVNPLPLIKQAFTEGPIDTAKSMWKGDQQARAEIQEKASEDFASGNKVMGTLRSLEGSVPLLGQAYHRVSDLAERGDNKSALGAATGLTANVMSPKWLPPVTKAGGKITKGVAGAAGRAGKKIAIDMETRALRPPPKAIARGDARAAAETTLEHGIHVSQKGRSKLRGKLDVAGKRIGELEDSAGPEPIVGTKHFEAEIEHSTLKAQAIGDKVSIRRAGRVKEGVLDTIDEGGMSVRDANLKKQALQDQVDYNNPKSITKAQKAGARGMRRDIAEAFPDIAEPNALFAELKNVEPFLENSLAIEFKKRGIARLSTLQGAAAPISVVVGAVAGGPIGWSAAASGAIIHVLAKATVRSHIAHGLYRASKGAMTLSEAKLSVSRLAAAQVGRAADWSSEKLQGSKYAHGVPALKKLPLPGGMSVMSTYEAGKSLPRTKVEMFKAAAAVLEKHGNMPVQKFIKTMRDEAGPDWQIATTPKGKVETISPQTMIAGGRAQLARLRTLSDDGVASMGLTPHKTIAERSDAGLKMGGDQFYGKDVPELVARYGEDKAREMMTNESIASPNQQLETSVEQMLDLEQFQNFGGEPPQFGRYEQSAGRQLAAGKATGDKVAGYDYAKKTELPGGPGVEEPKWLPVDTIHTKGSGFSNMETGTINKKTGRQNQRSVTEDIRSYTDMQLRMETQRLGLDRAKGQASNWVGTQRDLFKTHGKATPWAKLVLDEIDRREAGGVKVTADKFEFGENAPPTDLGRNVGHGIEYVDRKYSAKSASLMESKNGFTMTREGRPPTEGYSFSPYKQHEKTYKRALRSGDIERYAKTNEGLLSQPGHNLGGWKSGKRRVLDVSVHEMDFETAINKAREANQEAIWDHKNNVEIPVPKLEQGGNTTTIVRMKDGRIIESEPHTTSTTKNLPTHLSLLERNGLSPDDVAETGWRVNGELDWGGGGTVGKGGFTMGEYDSTKAKQ